MRTGKSGPEWPSLVLDHPEVLCSQGWWLSPGSSSLSVVAFCVGIAVSALPGPTLQHILS